VIDEPEFLTWEIVAALHRKSLVRFGGIDGERDRGALEGALAAAENTYFYGNGDLHDIGAAYAFHLAQSQGFLDGNKRTAVACAATFLVRNGCVDRADEAAVYDAMIAIAERRMNKVGLAAVLRKEFPLR
jgi:death-on-curing protein